MLHPVLQILQEFVPRLATALGPDTEIVLHDFSHPENSVIAIGGNLTGRDIGAPLTDLILNRLRQGLVDEDLLQYSSRTPDGKNLRSSTLFLRDAEGNAVGCLCINQDLSRWFVLKRYLEDVCQEQPLPEANESFAQNVEGMLCKTLDEVNAQVGLPVRLMKKEDKLRAVKLLDDQGVFLIKGAVERVAAELEVSRYTIYNYLDEIRNPKTSLSLST